VNATIPYEQSIVLSVNLIHAMICFYTNRGRITFWAALLNWVAASLKA
jgi:hypothetical protein